MRVQTYIDALWKATSKELPGGGCLVDPASLEWHLKVLRLNVLALSVDAQKLLAVAHVKISFVENVSTIYVDFYYSGSFLHIAKACVAKWGQTACFVSDFHRVPSNLMPMATRFLKRKNTQVLSSATNTARRFAWADSRKLVVRKSFEPRVHAPGASRYQADRMLETPIVLEDHQTQGGCAFIYACEFQTVYTERISIGAGRFLFLHAIIMSIYKSFACTHRPAHFSRLSCWATRHSQP